MRLSRFAWLFLLAFAVQGLFLIMATSPTADEVAFHNVNGYAYLNTRDYRMSPANPPLIREWMALPWFIWRPELDLASQSWKEADSVPFGKDFFYTQHRDQADRLLYSSRGMVLLLGLALGLLIYRWSSELYGPKGGLFSLALYSFCPNFLAHSSIATTDMGVTLFTVAAAYYLWKYLEGGEKYALHFSLALALAAAAKFNALLFIPVFLATVLFKKGWRAFFGLTLLSAASCFVVIWASYLFEFKPVLAGGVPRVDEKLAYLPDFIRHAAQNLPIPFPSYFLGLAGIVRSHRSPYLHYAFGEWTTTTQWFYYFFVFLVKMTLPFLAALGLRAVLQNKIRPAEDKNAGPALLFPALLWMGLTVFDSTAVGIRYLFVPVALFFVWIGGLGRLADRSKSWGRILVGLAAIQIIASALSFPHHLSYFSALVGRDKAYKYVRGSDVDWGQGLKPLKKYLDQNGIKEPIGLIYFGLASDPSFYGIRYEPLSNEELREPQKKFYAISAFTLEYAEWTHRYKPTAIVAGCVHVYDFRVGLPERER